VNSIIIFEARGRDGQPKFGAHIVALMPTAPARDKLIEGSTAPPIGRTSSPRR
jgi:hypothetical protein